MQTKIIQQLILASVLASASAAADPTLFEDFSDSISLDKFYGMEETIELDRVAEKLVFSAGGQAYQSKSRANNLRLVDNSTSLLQADLSITEATLSNPDTQQALLAVAGTFYNADSANPATELGEVFVRIAIGDRGNGLEAWYELQVSTADDWSSGTITEAKLADISLNTEYTATITYDGDNTFTFQFDQGSVISVDGPPRMGSAYFSARAINNRIRIGQDNSTPTLYDGMMDSGEPVSITGTVDNVFTDAGLVDDFSGADLNQAIWNADETSVEVVNGALEMKVTGQGDRKTERLWIKQKGLDAFGATITLLGSSTLNNDTDYRGRLTHYLSNDTYDIANGATPNGMEGFIWTQFMLRRTGGNYRAFVGAERVADANWDTYEDLFWEEVGPTINPDQPYALLIEKTGTLVEYKIDGAVVYSFDLATDFVMELSGNDYAPIGDTESGLQTRVENDAGVAHVRYDNIVTDYVPPVVALHAFNINDTQIAYPQDPVNVHEGETVDLVAAISDPARVSAVIWEQTAGMDVDVIIPNAPRGVVGNDPNLSFTVPVGANNDTLAFELTVLDNAGVDFNQAFAMRVDNSSPASFEEIITVVDDSSGGGVFNPLGLIALALLLGAARLRKQMFGRV